MRPIYEQIDPVRLAEIERLLRIASEYGDRLDAGNLKPGALAKLLAGYPSHGFVIDRAEAGTIFSNISEPTDIIQELGDSVSFLYEYWLDREPYTYYLGSRNEREKQGAPDVLPTDDAAVATPGGNSETEGPSGGAATEKHIRGKAPK
jgi:hypothetical protein